MLSNGETGLGQPGQFAYDPMNPVPSYGGNVCCTGNAVTGGAMDQRKMEARADILVYSSEPLKEGLEVSGPIEATLYVSSDAKDTDITVKVIDVYPGRHALTTWMRRFSGCVTANGYDKPLVWMEKGKVYKVVVAADDHQQLLSKPGTDSGWRSPAATSRASTAT